MIVTAKAPSLREVANAVEPLLTPDTMGAFATNGVFWFYGDGFAPGVVQNDGGGAFLFGEAMGGSDDRLKRIRDELSGCGFGVDAGIRGSSACERRDARYARDAIRS